MKKEVMSKKQTFEDALKKLQNIIEELESGSPSLDKMMQLFEDGMKLMQECRSHLTEVEERINTLIKVGEDYGVFQAPKFVMKTLKQIKRLMDKL